MKEVLDQHPEILGTAQEAFDKLGIPSIRKPIRGGTDGSRLTFMGLPTPNIFAGAVNMHAKTELVSLQTMGKSVEVILNIVSIVSDQPMK